jgi:hypothetical protein
LIEPPKPKETEVQFFQRPNPNDLWQMDHKKVIHGKWARRTYPFAVLDDCTRYLVGLKALPDTGFVSMWKVVWHLFGEFGLPRAVLTDNARIFSAFTGPSRFEVWLMRLGIDVLHGRPYHPQTQGKVERFNGTLERELLRNGCFSSAEQLQAEFDQFRHDYNHERPHESLLMEVPGALYRPSQRPRPRELPKMEYPRGAELRWVHKDGWITYRNNIVEVGVGLHDERVEVRETDYGVEVYYGRYRIRGKRFDEQTKTRDDKVGGLRRKASRRHGTPLRATPSAPFHDKKQKL